MSRISDAAVPDALAFLFKADMIVALATSLLLSYFVLFMSPPATALVAKMSTVAFCAIPVVLTAGIVTLARLFWRLDRMIAAATVALFPLGLLLPWFWFLFGPIP